MRAEILIECRDPEKVIQAIKPDIAPTEKFSARIESLERALALEITSKNISGLLAGINSYIRLIRTAIEALEG